MKKVVIYTGPRCAHCDWAKALLNKKNVNFIEYNVAEDSTKKEEMLKKSFRNSRIGKNFRPLC